MSDAAMRDAMVRMATDIEFARRVRDDGAAVARECGLSDGELATLQALDQADTPAGPSPMGERLSKSGLFGAGALSAALHFGPAADVHGLLCDGHADIRCDAHSFSCDGHADIRCDAHSFSCDGHTSIQCNDHPSLQCNEHVSLQCNEHVSLQCNDHALLCNGHSLLCDGHAGFQCNGHTSLQCNDHVSLQCNDHALLCNGHVSIQCNDHDATGVLKGEVHTDAEVAKGDGHEEIAVVKGDAHTGIQCNEHTADLKGGVDLHPPVVGSLEVHSLLPPAADAAPK